MFATGIFKILLVTAAGLPFGLPPQDEDPTLGRVAPEQCLLYVGWSGSSQPNASSSNEFEQLLAEPEIEMLLGWVEGRINQAVGEFSEGQETEGQESAKQTMKWAKSLITRPAALFLEEFEFAADGPKIGAGLIVNLGDDAGELQTLIGKLTKTLGDAATEVEIGGSAMYRLQLLPAIPPVTLGIKGKYFLAGIGQDTVGKMLQRGGTAAPAWLTDLRQRLKVERMSMIAYADVKSIIERVGPLAGPTTGELIGKLGLDNITSAARVGGLDKSGFVTRSLVGLDGAPKGILSAAVGPPITADDLKPIPRDAMVAAAARLDVGKLFDTAIETSGKINPGFADMAQSQIGALEEELGIRVRDELLGSIGDVWCAYHSPGEGGKTLGFAAAVRVKNHDVLQSVLNRLKEKSQAFTEFKEINFANQKIHFVNSPDPMPVAPAWCLTEDELIVALFPQNIKAYLSRGNSYKSLATSPAVAALLQADKPPTALFYQDTPTIFDQTYPLLLILAQAMLPRLGEKQGIEIEPSIFPSGRSIRRHLEPGVTAMIAADDGIEFVTRETIPGSNSALPLAAIVGAGAGVASNAGLVPDDFGDQMKSLLTTRQGRKMQSEDQLKQIVLALLNFQDVYRILPAGYSADADGKPLLSWRVRILPFVEHVGLSEQFRMNEPWDSEHNRKLIEKMPMIYRAPGSKAPPGMTTYLAVGGKNGTFGPPDENATLIRNEGRYQGLSLRDTTDGISNTIWIVEASDELAVPWTKPVEYKPDEANLLNGLVGLRRGGFLAVFGDSIVRMIPATADPNEIKALFTRNGGESVDIKRLLGEK